MGTTRPCIMSGLEGGDDGELSDDAVAALYEVAKQAKYLVGFHAPRCELRRFAFCFGDSSLAFIDC